MDKNRIKAFLKKHEGAVYFVSSIILGAGTTYFGYRIGKKDGIVQTKNYINHQLLEESAHESLHAYVEGFARGYDKAHEKESNKEAK